MISDLQLAQRLRHGDEEAFTLLYERYADLLLNHLLCMVGKQELAEELLHEVFINLINKINFFEDRADLRNSFKAWLYRIATNRAIDEMRKNKNIRFEMEAESISAQDPEYSFTLASGQHHIQTLLARLPLVQRTFLNLKINDDLNLFEISQICSCSVNNVKQGLFQARRSMKNMLLAEGFEL